jgi:membrane-associated phospholipid phosphatase
VTAPLPPWWHRLLGTRWLLLVLGAIVALVLLGALGDEVLEPGANVVDQVVRDWVLRHQSPPLVTLAWLLTNLGSTVATAGLGLAVTGWLWFRRHRRIAALAATAPIVATGSFDGLKQLFGRLRPPGALAAHIGTYSFPSGHATVATAVWLTLGYCLRRERLIPRWAALALGIAWPATIGLTRVYLDVHWATDVLGGWALGAAVAALVAGLYERTRQVE